MSNLFKGIRLIRMLNFDSHARLGPLKIDIAPTTVCNYRCSFCGTHSYRIPETIKPQYLGTGLNRLLADLSELGTKDVLFAGNGEPLLSDEMIHQIKRNAYDLRIEVLTNGSLLDRVDRDLFGKLYRLSISLNAGTGETHQAVHGYKGKNQFPIITANIERLLTYPGGNKKICLYYVVTEENKNEVQSFVDLARRYQVAYRIRPEVKITAAAAPAGGSGEPTVQKTLYPCFVGFIQPTITASGMVYQCYGCTPAPLGNINHDSFKDIWQGKIAKSIRFRAATMAQTGVPITSSCYNCQNALASSAKFYRSYSKIPFLKLLLDKITS